MEDTQNQPAADTSAVTVKDLSGYDEGETLPTGEIVKGSYDDNGKLVGWHKEAAGGNT